VDKVQNHARFGLDHAFHHDLSSIIPDRNRNTFLVMPRAALQGTCRLPDYADSKLVAPLNFLLGARLRLLSYGLHSA